MTNTQDKTKKRDEDLDIYRTFEMILVIVIHCLFWMGLWNTGTSVVLKSLLLFEMPIFFFVMGAVNYKSTKTLGEFYLARFQRILIPYWVYAGICIIFSFFVLSVIAGQNPDMWSIVITWLIPVSVTSHIPYLTWALWFVPVYLLIILLFPLLSIVRINNHLLFGGRKYAPLLLLTLGLIMFDTIGLGLTPLRHTVLYLFWVYLGTFYDEIKDSSTRKNQFALLAVLVAGCLAFLLGGLELFPYNMQENKFPPNTMFIIYSLGAMSLLYLIRKWILLVFQKGEKCILSSIIFEYKYHSLTVFLYQPFAFCLLWLIGKMIPIQWDLISQGLRLIFYLLVAIPVCALLGKLFGRFENIELIPIKRIWKKHERI